MRKARKECKQPFEMLWQSKKMTRDEAYEGLAYHMGLSVEEPTKTAAWKDCYGDRAGVAACIEIELDRGNA